MVKQQQQQQQPKQPSTSSSSAQVSAPTYHSGRRLIQMLFRSSNNPEETSSSKDDPPRKQSLSTLPNMQTLSVSDENHEERAASGEDEEKRRQRSRSIEEVDEMAEDQEGSSWRSQLKRKLFPRKRRHPARIPPLALSPINTEGVSLSPLNHQSPNGTPAPVGRINSYGRLPDFPSTQQQQPDNNENSSAMEETQVEAFDSTSLINTLEDIMRTDLRPVVVEVDTTLQEMNRTLADLQKWKEERLETSRKNTLALEDYTLEETPTTTGKTCSNNNNETAMTLEEEQDPLHLEYELKKQVWEQERAHFASQLNKTHAHHEHVMIHDETTESLFSQKKKLKTEAFAFQVSELSLQLQANHLEKIFSCTSLESQTPTQIMTNDDTGSLVVSDALMAFTSELDQVLAKF